MRPEEHVPTANRVLKAFETAVIPEGAAEHPSFLRKRSEAVPFHVVGRPDDRMLRVLSLYTARLQALTGIAFRTARANEHPSFALFVTRLEPARLWSEYGNILEAFYFGRDKRGEFEWDISQPIVQETRCLMRMTSDDTGGIVQTLTLIEYPSTTVDAPMSRNPATLQRIYREFARILGVRLYSFDIGHSIFNPASWAMDLTNLDIRILRTLYHRDLRSGMERAETLRVTARILSEDSN